jgi:hypothetical protein
MDISSISKHHNNQYSSSEDKNLQNVLYVEPTLFGSGKLNPFSNRLNMVDFTINTLFRPNYNTTLSTNFIFDLPIHFSKVASYELVTFSCNNVFYNINDASGSNIITIIIQNPPNNLEDISVTIKMDSGLYTATDIVIFFNNYFRSSTNGLEFLVCEFNTISNKFIFRMFSFWLDGYITQLIEDPANPSLDPELPNINKITVSGGGVYDELIIDPSDPTKLINNPFYKEDCQIIIDFSVHEFTNAEVIYRNLGWILGFKLCKYCININTCKTYYGNPYYNFLLHFSNTPYPVDPTDPPLTNNLYLQKYFDIMTSELNIYGYIQAEGMFINRQVLSSSIYLFLDIDDYNKNYNPLDTCSISEGFNSTFSPTTFSKITISNAGVSVNKMHRKFYGPVDISRMHIRLLDQYGSEMDLVNGDYSFTLRFTTIY